MTTPTSAQTTEVDQLSYEQARAELAQVVRQLEAGDAPLEQSLAMWERGEALATHCQNWLDQARARLEAASQNDQS